MMGANGSRNSDGYVFSYLSAEEAPPQPRISNPSLERNGCGRSTDKGGVANPSKKTARIAIANSPGREQNASLKRQPTNRTSFKGGRPTLMDRQPSLQVVQSHNDSAPPSSPRQIESQRLRGAAVAAKAAVRLQETAAPPVSPRHPRVYRPNTTSTCGWIATELQVGASTSIRKFDIQGVVGTGCMGTIRLAKCKVDGSHCALKCVRKDYLCRNGCVRHVLQEKRALAALGHPFIVDFFGTFQTLTWVVFALEFVPGGELFRRLMQNGGFPHDTAKFYAVELFSALEYIQASGYVYRDLKPENVLIDEHGHAKLCDFGFATEPEADGRCRSNVGTPCYLCPEQLNCKKTDGYQAELVDWWAYGCLVYELLVGRTPFESDGGKTTGDESRYEIYLRVLKGKIHWPGRAPPAPLRKFVAALVNAKVEARLFGAERVKRHPWLAGVQWDLVMRRRLRPPWVPALRGEGDRHFYEEHKDLPEKDLDVLVIDQAVFAKF